MDARIQPPARDRACPGGRRLKHELRRRNIDLVIGADARSAAAFLSRASRRARR